MKKVFLTSVTIFLAFVVGLVCQGYSNAQETKGKAEKGSYGYERFDSSKKCRTCHREIYNQYQNSAMAKSQILPWDQAEYFKLALPHTRLDSKVAPVEAGCIKCHAPLAFMAGDIPPPPAGKADPKADGVSCEVCHTMVGFDGEIPVNGNFVLKPGKVKYGPRKDIKSSYHKSEYSEFHKSAELCGTCHNETSPYGAWVKETYQEWKKGPYGEANISCMDCHEPPSRGKSAIMGQKRDDVAQHLFLGSYSQTWMNGSAVVAVYPKKSKIKPGETLKIQVVSVNQRAGHMIPTGSTEERQLWLHLEAKDAKGNIYHIKAPLAPGDTPDKSYSVATNKPAYKDLGYMMGVKEFKGIPRDALPEGDRLFRKVFLNPQGEETIAQWNAANTEVFDNRLGPLEASLENYEWKVPDDVAKGKLTITADLNYRRLPQSVADLVGIGKVPVLDVAHDQVAIEIR
ncbi:MAG: cytochrome c family protein [Deltaproteobacteria bacterium]|nr:cytochrome c family protein [Deltaproteobacteria bacterium]